MAINETEEKKRSLLKAEKPMSEISPMELEKRKNLLWELLRNKFTNGDPWAVAEICEIQYTLTRKEVEREQSRSEYKRSEVKQSIDEASDVEWESLSERGKKPLKGNDELPIVKKRWIENK
jgi:hypothetical protein